MEIKQLEIFLGVAKNLSFSKTAEELYISQPTVSACISSLEKQLGAQLLIRNTKEVSLTKAGVDFVVYAQKILSLREQAMHSIGGRSADTKGAIDIISSTIPAQHLLPEIIAAFQKKWKNVVFRVEQADSLIVEREIGGFRYDFGMAGAITESGRFIHYPVYDDELVLVAPNGASQSVEEIQKDIKAFILQAPFIMREDGSGTRKETEALLAALGANPLSLNIPAYLADAQAILLAVSRGLGVSIVSRVAAAMYVEAGLVKAVNIDNTLSRRKIYLLHNKELLLSPVQEAFAEFVKDFY